jgi:hypothetical protein
MPVTLRARIGRSALRPPATKSDGGNGRTCRLSARTQMALEFRVAASTANTVAVLRTVPALVMSGSDTAVCWSASFSSRVLTLCS